jgi:hypothetical protein
MHCRAFAGYHSYNSFGSSSYDRFKNLMGYMYGFCRNPIHRYICRTYKCQNHNY